jgi:ElaB/YqjD/DUF883 family membrane-anchored ribosome-binding protein
MDTRSDQMNQGENVDDPEVIRARIEETRANMSETVDHIQERLSPDHLKQQVQETVRDATIGRVEQMADTATRKARNWRSNMVETIKQNPVPAALAGFGLAWLFMAGTGDEEDVSTYYTTRGYSRSPGTYRYAGGEQYREADRLHEAQRKVGDTARHLQEEASQVTQQARDQAEQVAHQAQQQVEEWRDEAEYQMQRAKSGFQQMLVENPLAVGAAAIAIGAAVGLAIPNTEQENELMGQTRDRLVDQAQSTAQETMQKVRSVAEKATTAAEEEAMREAERQDLPKPSGRPLREDTQL